MKSTSGKILLCVLLLSAAGVLFAAQASYSDRAKKREENSVTNPKLYGQSLGVNTVSAKSRPYKFGLGTITTKDYIVEVSVPTEERLFIEVTYLSSNGEEVIKTEGHWTKGGYTTFELTHGVGPTLISVKRPGEYSHLAEIASMIVEI